MGDKPEFFFILITLEKQSMENFMKYYIKIVNIINIF